MEIINQPKMVERFWSKVEKSDGCWNWTSATCWGYGVFHICGQKQKKTHRISFELHHERAIVPGLYLLHSCDNKKCVNPNHLSEGTHQDNSDDKVAKGRQAKGCDVSTSKLTEAQVLEIRTKYALMKKKSTTELGKEYGVNNTTIGRIVSRKLWKHL